MWLRGGAPLQRHHVVAQSRRDPVGPSLHAIEALFREVVPAVQVGHAVPHLSDLAFKNDLARLGEEKDPVSKVEMRTLIGGKNGAKALDLSMPLMIAPMSYGALSRSAKQAVAIASGQIGRASCRERV